MAPEREWGFAWNVNIQGADSGSTGQNGMYELKKLFSGSLQNAAQSTGSFNSGNWTILSSSNGTTCDTSDNWNAASDVVWNVSGSNHSWIMFQKDDYPLSGSTTYAIIDCDNTNAYQHSFLISTELPFSGSTTGRPDTNDAKTYDFSDIQFLIGYSVSNLSYSHGSRSSVGDIVAMTTRQGFNYARWGMILNALDTPRTSVVDPWPLFLANGYYTTSPGFWATATNYQALSSTSCVKTFWINGNMQALGHQTGILRPYNTTAVNFQMTLMDSAGSDIDGKYPAMPAYIGSAVANFRTLRGRMIDIFNAPHSGITIGTVEPATGTPTSCLIGHIWIPCNDTPVI